jgi:hypothetical protein
MFHPIARLLPVINLSGAAIKRKLKGEDLPD